MVYAKVEIALCGHDTLAVTHILNQKGLLCDGESISFTSLSGALWVTVQQGKIEMDFPAPCIDYSVKPSLVNGLGLTATQVVSSGLFEYARYCLIYK